MNLFNTYNSILSKTHEYENFLIVGTQRTGSSALAEIINTHPEIACGWEWTEHTPYLKKLSALKRGLAGDFIDLNQKTRRHILESINPKTRWLGFRRLFGASDKWLFTPQMSIKLAWDRFQEHLCWLRVHPRVRVIHIVRNDHIAWLKSKFVSRRVGSFIGETYPEDVKVRIPVNEAIARIQSKLWIDHQLQSLSKTNPYIQICYEHLAEDLSIHSAVAVRFLDCDADGIDRNKTIIRKQSTRPTSDYITNYWELVNALRKHNTDLTYREGGMDVDFRQH